MTQQGLFEAEDKYVRLGQDGKVYYITAAEAAQEEVIVVDESEVQWDRHVRNANRIADRAVKIYKRASISPGLLEVYHRAMLQYRAEVAHLEQVFPDRIRQLCQSILGRLAFLERKLEVLTQLEKKGVDSLYTGFERTLMQYEVLYDQAEALMEVALNGMGYLLMVTGSGDKVAFVKEGKEHLVPEGYIAYTDKELKCLQGDIPRLVHATKKLTRASVTT